jgi:ERCC4-type nuclease
MIYVDNRGSNEKAIAQILEDMSYPVTVQHLDSGDYVIGDLAIERKTVPDLLGSVYSQQKGHDFWMQIKVMKDTYKKVLVIIEGFIDWKDRSLKGIIYALTDGWQIPYINTNGIKQSAERIGDLHDRCGAAKVARVPPAAVKKGYTIEQIRCMMAQTIPHVGPVVAKRIIEKNPHIFSHTNYLVDLNIEGLQKSSKEMIVKVLTE